LWVDPGALPLAEVPANRDEAQHMKLIRFIAGGSSARFGVVVRGHAVSFSALQCGSGQSHPHLADSRAYLANLPESERSARELQAWGQEHLEDLAEQDRPAVDAVRLLEPIDVAALYDFSGTLWKRC